MVVVAISKAFSFTYFLVSIRCVCGLGGVYVRPGWGKKLVLQWLGFLNNRGSTPPQDAKGRDLVFLSLQALWACLDLLFASCFRDLNQIYKMFICNNL